VNDPTFAIRVALGLGVFAVLALIAFRRDPRHPRLAEYAFLFGTTACVMLYAVAHNVVTYHIAPIYFDVGYGLDSASDGLSWDVAELALKAGWTKGLLGGAVLLMANNPTASGAQLGYDELVRCVAKIIGLSVPIECIFGSVFVLSDGVIATYRGTPELAGAGFFTVWGLHLGAYAGGAIGVVWAVVWIRRKKHEMDVDHEKNSGAAVPQSAA